MKKTLNGVIGLGIAIFLLMYVFVFNKQVSKNQLPELQESLINGEAFDIQNLKGNIILLDFWGSWCPPCRKENPQIAVLYNKYHNANFGQAHNFEIVSVAIEKKASRAQKAIEKDGLDWPYHIIQESKIVLASSLAINFGVTDLPTKFLYDESGKLIGKNMSIVDIHNFLESKLID